MSDPYYKNVIVLLPFDEDNPGVSYLTDYSLNKGVASLLGNASKSSAKSKYGSTSLYLDGVGDYLTIPSSSEFDFGVRNFTAECWIYPTSYVGAGTYGGIIGKRYAFNVFNGWVIYVNGATNVLGSEISTAGSTSNGVITGSAVTLNVWSHVALVRTGSSIKLYLNGTAVGSAYNIGSAPVFHHDYPFQVGVLSNGFNTNTFPGYISDVRVTNGVARYTANFTPPASLKSLTFDTLDQYYAYVVLALPCDSSESNTPADYSKWKRGILKSGDGGLSPDRGKFDSISWKFNGTHFGEINPGSNLAFGSGDYTVDFWIWMNYATNHSQAERILVPKNTTNQTGAFQLTIPGDTSIGGAPFTVSLLNSVGSAYLLNTVDAINDGVWHHIALCRCNANNLTYLFLDGVLKQSVLDVSNYTLLGTEGAKIGARADGTSTTFLNAYLDEFRITTGIARWVSNFTPPTVSIKNSLPDLPTFTPKIAPKTIFNRGFNWQALTVKKSAKELIKRKLGLNWQELAVNKKVIHLTTSRYFFAEWSSLLPYRKVRTLPSMVSSFKNSINWGGTGNISGTVKIGTEFVRKKVRLYDSKTGLLLQEKWSDIDGTYLFTGLKKEVLYTVTVTDETQTFNDEIFANITAL